MMEEERGSLLDVGNAQISLLKHLRMFILILILTNWINVISESMEFTSHTLVGSKMRHCGLSLRKVLK